MRLRKQLPDELVAAYDAFHAVLDEVEPAKAGLADVMPGTRLPGRPLGHALDEFVQRLERAAPLMAAWRREPLEDVWVACDDGLRRSLERARRLAGDGVEPEGFEALLGVVEHLLDPLDPFAVAEDRFRRLRRR
jgi:hypothetical protein